VNDTYRVTLRNPSGNPSEIEEEYIPADSQHEADLKASDLAARHPFDDVEVVAVELVEPGELYHEETPA
jgi:hypothetical protein